MNAKEAVDAIRRDPRFEASVPVASAMSLPFLVEDGGAGAFCVFLYPVASTLTARKFGPPFCAIYVDRANRAVRYVDITNAGADARGKLEEHLRFVSHVDYERARARWLAALDRAAPAFHEARAPAADEAAARRDLAELFPALAPSPLRDTYRALAPEFFRWIEA